MKNCLSQMQHDTAEAIWSRVKTAIGANIEKSLPNQKYGDIYYGDGKKVFVERASVSQRQIITKVRPVKADFYSRLLLNILSVTLKKSKEACEGWAL